MKLFWLLAASIKAQEGSGDAEVEAPEMQLDVGFGDQFVEYPEFGEDEFGEFGDFGLDTFDLSQFGRSSFDVNQLDARQLPPGISMMNYVGADGQFDMSAFREALVAAYQNQGQAPQNQSARPVRPVQAQPARPVRPAQPARPVRPAQPARPVRPAQPVASVAASSGNRPTGNRPQAANQDEDRYFFTATTATTTTTPGPPVTPPPPPQGTSCWKCDAMTYTDCAASGSYQECPLGDLDCCFVEIRTKHRDLQQLCTGCKERNACRNNQNQNYAVKGKKNHLWDQCREDFRQQAYNLRQGHQQSVCRQCFDTCTPTEYKGRYCFGGGIADHDSNTSTPPIGILFKIPFALHADKYPGSTWNTAMANREVYGIPTHLRVTSGLDSTTSAAITSFDSKARNIYFGHTDPVPSTPDPNRNGKVNPETNNDNNRDLDDMTYWGLEGASQAWWESDLKKYQVKWHEQSVVGCQEDVAPHHDFINCAAPYPATILDAPP